MPLRRKNTDGVVNEYELQQQAQIARNKQHLESLNIPTLSNAVQEPPAKKRTKKTYPAPTDGHNLRPRLQKCTVDTVNEQIIDAPDYIPTGDFLCNNEDLLTGTQQKRNGRGITQMKDILFRTPDMPKIKLTLNEYGQPVAETARKLASVIGTQVRKKLSVGCKDWRLVDPNKKLAVWNDMKAFYDMDDDVMKWFMDTAARKWKDYKADLKEKYFDESMTDEELKARIGKSVNAADFDYLIRFWRTPESEARTARGKANRAKVQQLHTSGSVSHACHRHDLGKELGRTPRRDEVYIKTHTRKNGVPLMQAQSTINVLKAVVEAHPELKDRSIEEGDAYAAVCGEKEPKGRVRVLGLGPTPQEIRTPGLKSYMSTRLQLEVLARRNSEIAQATLGQRIAALEEQLEQQRMALERQNAETLSQHGSNSRQHMSPRSEENVDAHYDARREEYGNVSDNEDCGQDIEVPPVSAGMNAINTARNASRFTHDGLVGKEVILFAMLKPDLPIAKGIILSVNPKTILGGQPLGKQFCEVMVEHVIRRDALLPRPYDHMESMAGAYMMSIAWPYERLKPCNNASGSSKGTPGTVGRH